MNPAADLSPLFDARRLWRGSAQPAVKDGIPTGLVALDAMLPQAGWPPAALSEILLPLDGIGELQLLLPSLAALTRAGHTLAIVAPPYLPCVAGWSRAGVDMRHVDIIDAATPVDALWAMEQCLRSSSYAAVLGWPLKADDRALRRLQIAADTGQALAFVFRDWRHAEQASPAALRIELQVGTTSRLRVRKCRGGQPPAGVFELPRARHN
ncbi:MAG: translesion DNA synthesis-associated protein ImuA [Rhodanobacter sp.]